MFDTRWDAGLDDAQLAAATHGVQLLVKAFSRWDNRGRRQQRHTG